MECLRDFTVTFVASVDLELLYLLIRSGISFIVICVVVALLYAVSIAFFNSLMLPGQSYL